jgi:hypothetical protein
LPPPDSQQPVRRRPDHTSAQRDWFRLFRSAPENSPICYVNAHIYVLTKIKHLAIIAPFELPTLQFLCLLSGVHECAH